MSDAVLNRLLTEAQTQGAQNWVKIIAGAMDRLPECRRLVRELLEQQPETHWSRQ